MLKVMETIVEPEIVPFIQKATDFVTKNILGVVVVIGIISVVAVILSLRKRYY